MKSGACSDSNYGGSRCLQGNQTILVWFGGSGNSPLPQARQTRMVWLPWSLQPLRHGISAKIRIAAAHALRHIDSETKFGSME